MIHHIVTWKLSGQDEAAIDEQAAVIAAGLEALVGVVPSIESFVVGRNIVQTEASYDLALVSEFVSLDALQAYQEHPAHVAVAELIRGIAVARTVVDFERV